MMSRRPGPLGADDAFLFWPRTPGPLGHNDAASPESPDWFRGDTPGSLGVGDGAAPDLPETRPLLLASLAPVMPEEASPPPEHVPALGTNQATLRMYDHYFNDAGGATLKARIEAAAGRVDLNPGLIAASLFAEDRVGSYTKASGEVEGWLIGTDDYGAREADIHRRVPASVHIRPIRYEPHTNEHGRLIPRVPVFKAEDAVLASAAYLKYAECQVRDALAEAGGSFDRLPVEYRFALTRYALNAGGGAVRKRARELLGVVLKRGKFVHNGRVRDFLQFRHGALEHGVERFNRHKPQRGATAHTAQAIHLSQTIFGINPLVGNDGLLFFH
jgi:hypothetical protein